MEKRYYPQVDETLYRETLPCGLEIAVLPRPGFSKKLCYLVTDFGAIHTEFTIDGETCHVPGGVAHYLEHKLFDMPGRDITEEFSTLGAVPNAFTGYDMTAYYFSCAENFYDNLKLLLEFVTTGYFTPESVQKEQGIIGQEILMNEDSPDNVLFEMLVRAMYENHPIRVPILGTQDSIAQITPQVLQSCHRAFYRPENLLLCAIGDIDPDTVAKLARQAMENLPTPSVTAVKSWEEPMAVKTPFVTRSMEVSMPMFQLGFKCEDAGKGPDAIRQEAIGDLACEALFGESSALYMWLYEEGIIDGSFGGGFETVDGMALLTASGDSDFPEKVKAAILQEAARLVAEGLKKADFLRMKRSALGRRLRDLDSFDATCFRVCAYHFSGYDYFRFPEIYETITQADILEFLQRVVTEDRCCMAIIKKEV